jgi:hypothetical protein
MSELGHSDAPPTYVLLGGILDRRLDEVQPAFPEALTSEKPVIVPTATSSGRRTTLANWIASPQSLYVFTRRSLPYPLLETFDMATAQEVHSKRDVTTTPLQALTLFHSDVVFGWSQALAG